ncbi:hypothetical protein P7K49_032306 [Saguinus oedipus]|uniref:Proteasome assembly chaperone 1 n=1 Tax=Saguinus oedipus TaxID=9490 RepID=A0ABQ9TYQ2_SAGOE|nr:hypothetical protein P7K49_032306 [Saguinus oedipus]
MAATFFGEVVKAPCRAGTEDEEEEDEGRRETPEDREVRQELARKRAARSPPREGARALKPLRRLRPGLRGLPLRPEWPPRLPPLPGSARALGLCEGGIRRR